MQRRKLASTIFLSFYLSISSIFLHAGQPAKGPEKIIAFGDSLTAGLGLLPLALSAGRPGRELDQPMAVVIIGGLLTSTLLNMFVLPALYLKFGRTVEAEQRVILEQKIAREHLS